MPTEPNTTDPVTGDPLPAWCYTWTCQCGTHRMRWAWTSCRKCGMKCPEPHGEMAYTPGDALTDALDLDEIDLEIDRRIREVEILRSRRGGDPPEYVDGRSVAVTSAVNVTTGDLDVLQRIAHAQREVREIADALLRRRTSKIEDRRAFGRRLNAVNAQLKTVEMYLGGDTR